MQLAVFVSCDYVIHSTIFQTKYPSAVSWKVGSMGQGCGLANAKKYNYIWCKDGLLHSSCLLVSCLLTEWPPVACKLYLSGLRSHANCTRLAASRMQISVDFIHVACDWRPHSYNFHATGGHSGTICMWLAATRIQFECDWPPVFWKHTARTTI